MATTRITSLMSGMDTDSLIQEMMSAARAPLDKFEKQKTTVTWQRETLLDLNSEMLAFQNAAFDMRLEGTYKKYNADSSNSLIASAVAGTSAIEGTYRLKASQLASATTRVGSQRDTAITSTGWATTTNLNLSGTSMKITLNGETKTISFGEGEGDFRGMTSSEIPGKLEELLSNKINNAFGGEQIAVDVSSMSSGRMVKVSISSKSAMNYSIVVGSGEEGADALSKLKLENNANNIFNTGKTVKDLIGEEALDASGNISVKINGKTFEFSGERTLSEVFKTLSDDEDIDISMKYDKIANSIIMQRDNTGSGREIDISDEHGFFAALGLTEEAGGTYTMGQNAVVTITDPEGRVIEDVQMTSNNFEYQGVAFSVLKADPESEVAITVAKDTEAIYNSIMGFVDKYNNLLGKLNELYNEEKNKNYEPLTDAEREKLSDTQQEKWEKMARSGILRRDSTLQSAISDMRSAVQQVMNTTGINSLFQMGISTTTYSAYGNNNGKLIVDSDKLKEAINNDIDGVANFFTSTPTNITGTSLSGESTLALNGKSMNITVGSNTYTLAFNQNYDISTSEGQSDLTSYINEQLATHFGANNVTVSISSGRFVINSAKQNTVTVNTGTSGGDALSVLRLDDGATYDGTKVGFANRMYAVMSTAMQAVQQKAGTSKTGTDDSVLGQKMSRLNSYISKQQDRLATLEERYYKQFAAMEDALSKLNSQSSYINSMLGLDS
ncbi:MAG: flagellar filament capping protein FliD [Clostridia bacterium]|nr:flagellar filament capping protein FliD [Clostridia bacterium]